MDFSAQLEKLQQQANETVASIRSASAESRDQLKQRIDQARVDTNLALMDVKQQAEETSDQVQSKWAQLKADASVWMDDIKAKIDKRVDQRDAKTAAKDADRAEQDAADAIDYAVLPSTVRSSRCSTRWMRALTQTSAPRSPTHKRAPWTGWKREHPRLVRSGRYVGAGSYVRSTT